MKKINNDVVIHCQEDCENSPRKALLKEFNIAFAHNSLEYILDQVSDDISWFIAGEVEIKGIQNFKENIQKMEYVKVSELVIHHIITHGKTAAVNGRIKTENKRTYEFCDVYLFMGAGKNSKIKEMTSYEIET
ncbi:hypothetical protein SAMN05192559_102427 [Halobacillus karajensis]|uniref:nuclear transport factor 2 family protein n=1 Tax=Halobacillus karajensis TaxID=195088 RepID=UPI0008A79B43|nr:nuclear transport factor 2 family protein [Halobacillus karajensis]SEH64028.1 hypothetical protein SAMN05192559_102427 [Halobacillus karajensis]